MAVSQALSEWTNFQEDLGTTNFVSPGWITSGQANPTAQHPCHPLDAASHFSKDGLGQPQDVLVMDPVLGNLLLS